MNHEILLRLIVMRNRRVIEAYLDQRLSFRDNFYYLQQLTGEDLSKAIVYDPNKKLFLDETVPLKEYQIGYFMLLELFT